MSAENMRIWSAVEKTDPRHTKPVRLGSMEFTSIDATYQIQRATGLFGPVGVGWGYEASRHFINAGEAMLVVVDVTVWHGSRENRYGPVTGMNTVLSQKGRLDEDAPKKALTDALTKALSHLGFSADVFLGRFDDNRYVAGLREEFGSPEEPITPKGSSRGGDRPRDDAPPRANGDRRSLKDDI